VCGLPIWAQVFLMPDRCKQQPKTRFSTCKTEVVHRCKTWRKKYGVLMAEFTGRNPGFRFAENTDVLLVGRTLPHVAYEDITNIGEQVSSLLPHGF
jgi:hypothetical protein